MNDNELLLALSNMMDEKLQPIKEDVSSLKEDVSSLKEDASILKQKVTKIEIQLENEIVPRLENIETHYVSTARRYADGIEAQEKLQSDVFVLNTVVTEHSIDIQNLKKTS